LDNAGSSSGYVEPGTWTVPGGVHVPPSVGSVSPANGSGSGGNPQELFTFQFSDLNGYVDILRAQVVFNSGAYGAACCIWTARETDCCC
jgi:hypothetical protein